MAKRLRGDTRAAWVEKPGARRAAAAGCAVVTRIRTPARRSGRPARAKDLTIFTRQLATMVMKAGAPSPQAFDPWWGDPNASRDAPAHLTSAPTWKPAPRSMPHSARTRCILHNLYCNLVEAGEAAGILVLDCWTGWRCNMEKTEAMKSKIKSMP